MHLTAGRKLGSLHSAASADDKDHQFKVEEGDLLTQKAKIIYIYILWIEKERKKKGLGSIFRTSKELTLGPLLKRQHGKALTSEIVAMNPVCTVKMAIRGTDIFFQVTVIIWNLHLNFNLMTSCSYHALCRNSTPFKEVSQ